MESTEVDIDNSFQHTVAVNSNIENTTNDLVNQQHANIERLNQQQNDLQKQLSELGYDETNTCDDQAIAFVAEMNGIFVERLTEIDQNASGDYKLKYVTYKEWVDMLIGVIRHMYEALSEIELNAKSSINILERKLSECKIFDKIDNVTNDSLRNDLGNLLALIRRAIDDGKWDTTGLTFKTITQEQIFGKKSTSMLLEVDVRKLNSKIIDNGHQIDRLVSQNNMLKTESETKDIKIANLEKQLKRLEQNNECKCHTSNEYKKDRNFRYNEEIEQLKNNIADKEKLLTKELEKNETLTTELEILRSKCERKEKVIDSMKSLAFEVADKHDQIQQHRSQLSDLEDELQQALKKIQFKDSVIKDLRRDLKNHLTKQLPFLNNDNLSTPRSYYTAINSPDSRKSDANNFQTADIQLNLSEIDKIDYQQDEDMNKRFQVEESKIIACQAEEEMNIKILELELDELCQLKQCVDGESSIELDHLIQRFRQNMRQVVIDQISSKNKLKYVRDQLFKIVHGSHEVKNVVVSTSDIGYMSQDENELDHRLLTKVSARIIGMENELNHLKNQIEELQMEIESAHSNVNSKTQLLEKNSKVLKDLAEHFSQISGANIDVETEFHEINVFRKVFSDAVETVIQDKDKIIQKLKDYNHKFESDSRHRDAIISDLQNQLKLKDDTLEHLTINLRVAEESIKILEHEKSCLNQEIDKLSNLLNNSDLKKVLNENEELHILNKNQITTISSLMAALESVKIGQQGNASINNIQLNKDSTAISDTNSEGSGSLWSWWRSGATD